MEGLSVLLGNFLKTIPRQTHQNLDSETSFSRLPLNLCPISVLRTSCHIRTRSKNGQNRTNLEKSFEPKNLRTKGTSTRLTNSQTESSTCSDSSLDTRQRTVETLGPVQSDRETRSQRSLHFNSTTPVSEIEYTNSTFTLPFCTFYVWFPDRIFILDRDTGDLNKIKH